MKNCSLILCLLTTLMLNGYVHAQINQPTNSRVSSLNFEGTLAANNMMRSRNILQEIIAKRENKVFSIENIIGTPYQDQTFKKANLMYQDSIQIGEYLMRYHAYADEMEISDSDGINFLNKAHFIRVHMNGEVYRTMEYKDNVEVRKTGFFIEKLIDPAGASVYMRKYKSLKPGKEAKTSFHKAEPPQFISQVDYYLKFTTQSPIILKDSKNKIIKTFPTNNDKLKVYAKQEKLDLRTEESIISLAKFYNNISRP